MGLPDLCTGLNERIWGQGPALLLERRTEAKPESGWKHGHRSPRSRGRRRRMPLCLVIQGTLAAMVIAIPSPAVDDPAGVRQAKKQFAVE
jgi:hypothetical protein